MTAAQPAYHAMTKAGRDLWKGEPVCQKPGIPAHRLVIPNTSTLLAIISCRRCRLALNWPAAMDGRKGTE